MVNARCQWPGWGHCNRPGLWGAIRGSELVAGVACPIAQHLFGTQWSIVWFLMYPPGKPYLIVPVVGLSKAIIPPLHRGYRGKVYPHELLIIWHFHFLGFGNLQVQFLQLPDKNLDFLYVICQGA